MRAARWSDHDRYFGPFTLALGDYWRTIAVCLRSTDDEDRDATFRISVGRCSLLTVVPKWLIRPERKRVEAKYWSQETIERMGRDWYWDIIPREYGFSINEGHLSVEFGRVTHDSLTEQRWGCFLPWTQWRHIRITFYGLEGERVGSVFDADHPARSQLTGASIPGRYDVMRELEKRVPKQHFAFADYDGQELVATTHIEEREWRFGTGWFKWLSWFRARKIRRSLSLTFSGETGPEKGSWKGGTIGTSIEMLPGELHEAAFRRYCDEQHRSKYRPYTVKFVGRAA